MKVIASPSLVFLILSLAATLFLKFSSSLFVFFLFNTIILALIVGNYRPPFDHHEVDHASSYSFRPSYEDQEYQYEYNNKNDHDIHGNIDSNDDDSDSDAYRKENWFSDGYDEDDDDSGSDGEIGWDDDDDDNDDENDEIDESFRERIEDFIAKVNKGWKEEWLREFLENQ